MMKCNFLIYYRTRKGKDSEVDSGFSESFMQIMKKFLRYMKKYNCKKENVDLFDEGDDNLSYITCDNKGNALTLELRIL